MKKAREYDVPKLIIIEFDCSETVRLIFTDVSSHHLEFVVLQEVKAMLQSERGRYNL